MSDKTESIEFTELKEALSSGLVPRLVIAVCSIGAMFALLLTDASAYTARSRIQVDPVESEEPDRMQWSIEDLTIVAQSDRVLESLAGRVELDFATDIAVMRDRGLLRANKPASSRFIDLFAKSRSSETALLVANAYAESLVEELNDTNGTYRSVASVAVAAGRPTHRAIPVELGFAVAVAFAYLFGATLSIARYRLGGSGLLLGVKSRDVLEALTPGAPALAFVPTVSPGYQLLTITNPGGPESESFGSLRAALEFASVDDELEVLQVTSASAWTGKTMIAANLAVSMAQAGRSVAIIDGNLRRPRLHEYFGLDQVPGLTSAILGRETLNTAARELRLDNGRLRVYPSGPIPPGPAELLGSKRAGEVFDALKRTFDVVIVDSPPVLPVADALVIAQFADATLLVANAMRTRRNELSQAYEALIQSGANVIGTVLNQAPNSAISGYGYGYGHRGRFGSLFRGPLIEASRRSESVLDRSELPKFESAGSFSPRTAVERQDAPADKTSDRGTAGAGQPNATGWGDDISI